MPKVRRRKSKPKPKAVGAYIFAGLFTVGVCEHFDVLCHLEDGPFGVATARKNWPDMPIHTDPATWPTKELRREGVTLIYCNPPCAPWSKAAPSPPWLWIGDMPGESCEPRDFTNEVLLAAIRVLAAEIEDHLRAYPHHAGSGHLRRAVSRARAILEGGAIDTALPSDTPPCSP